MVKYQLRFQYRPKGSERPVDGVSSADIEFDSDHAAPLVPLIGDHVFLVHSNEPKGATFDGKVVSRLFSYLGNQQCAINIVVAEVDVGEFGSLIRE